MMGFSWDAWLLKNIVVLIRKLHVEGSISFSLGDYEDVRLSGDYDRVCI